MRRISLFLLLPTLAGALSAQSNAVVGLDGRLTVVDNLTYYGRRGPAYPNGEVGMAMLNEMCNPGTVGIPWYAAMQSNHPKFGFMIARVANDRIEQISDWSYCKHAFVSTNYSGSCGTCTTPGGPVMGINCSDTYGAGNNADRFWLGPPSEIDPWLGTWNPVGSYFDQGDPNVGAPQNMDGVRSPSYSGSDPVRNRVTVKESDLITSGAAYYYGIHLIHQGEAVANRGDNLASRGFNPTHSGSNWSLSNNSVGQAWGTILQRWPGASVDVGQNGNADGRFFVAVKVTALGAGNYHYEYAVHNVDNSRAGAAFRVPVDAAAVVTNFTFGDIDGNVLNDWTGSKVGTEIAFLATAGNPLEWNTIYNFGFDCNVAPSFGVIHLDEARIGAGALQVAVPSEVPSGIPAARVTSVGDSSTCGGCDSAFYEFMPSNGFDLNGSSMTMALNAGEYTASTGSTPWANPAGTVLALGDDTQTTVSLQFSLPYPGGSTNTLAVCSNGFVSSASNGTSYTPSTSAFIGFGNPCWSGLWTDINPAAGGQVRFESMPTMARITWDAVPYYGSSSTATYQYEFHSNGTVHVRWQNVMPQNGDDFLVGWTPAGGPADPGNTDLSAALPGGIALCATPFSGLGHDASARPILGTTITLDTTGIPAGTPFGVLVKSLTQYLPPLDLGTYGMPGCYGHAQNGVTLLFLPTGSSYSNAFAIPTDPSFTGLEIVSQSFTYSPGLTPLGIVASNGVVLTLGPQ